MKLYIKLLIPCMMLLAMPIYGMEESSPRIAIVNKFGDRIKVLWKTEKGKNRYQIINCHSPYKKDPIFITSFDKFGRDSALTFQAYGKVKGWLSWSTSVNVKDLEKELKGTYNEDLYIQVLPWGGVSFGFEYSTEARIKDVLRLNLDILRNFPALEYHEEIIQAIKAERDKKNYKKDFDLIFTGYKNQDLDRPIKDKKGNQIATVEDVYRYILGLDTNYTKEDVEGAYSALRQKFSPSARPEKERKKLAKQKLPYAILSLLAISKDRLIDGLKSK